MASRFTHSHPPYHVPPHREEVTLLTESEVQRSFNLLFARTDLGDDAFERAEALLDELRPESPLRHRLSVELDEIRKLRVAN